MIIPQGKFTEHLGKDIVSITDGNEPTFSEKDLASVAGAFLFRTPDVCGPSYPAEPQIHKLTEETASRLLRDRPTYALRRMAK